LFITLFLFDSKNKNIRQMRLAVGAIHAAYRQTSPPRKLAAKTLLFLHTNIKKRNNNFALRGYLNGTTNKSDAKKPLPQSCIST